ncbi:MAG TPA: methylenetetrahydrofolate reductase [Acidimicrobiales bacterium]|nr:methylenetetrahydrofolate reductase [Acidimicrobiales bacterium]
MARIDALVGRGFSLSFELWPPRTETAAARLAAALEGLAVLQPTFASITYGAAGSTRARTHELVLDLQRSGRLVPMAHLTCAAHTRAELAAALGTYAAAGVENVLALRGDPPLDATGTLAEGELAHAVELVELAKETGDFCVAVAAHPEGHPDSPDLASDRRHLAAKLAVADLAITQFFFELGDYLGLVSELSALGVDKPVLPGVMPITNVRTLSRMAELSGCAIPAHLAEQIAAAADRPDEVRKIGVEVATELCGKLLGEGVPGLHFYTMNEAAATLEVCANLGLPGTGR